jgi:hypothetical protein
MQKPFADLSAEISRQSAKDAKQQIEESELLCALAPLREITSDDKPHAR